MSTINAAGTLYIRDTGSIEYSTDNTNWSDINAIDWPVTIQNSGVPGSTLKVLFTTNITLTANDEYFICGSNNIQFGNESLNPDGSRPTININGATIYQGLIQNGTASSNGNNNISIYNVIVNGNAGTLSDSGGWIGQNYFSKGASNNTITNCSTSGTIPQNGGGIVGIYTSNITINMCNSSGNIGIYGGGIIGSNGNSIIINNCSSIGTITASAGGICGSAVNDTDIRNSYSTGNIIGPGAGGIAGANANNSSTINCYSLGNNENSLLYVGGIFGDSNISINLFAINCYCFGTNISNIFGNNGTIPSTCYVANGNWITSIANTILTGVPTTSNYGTTWSQPDGPNTPYKLSSSGFSPYSLTLTNTVSQSVVQGASSNPGVSPGYTYLLLTINNSNPSNYPSITVNSSTGIITTTSSTPVAIYTVIIYSSINPYSVTTYTLTVTVAPTPPTPAGGAGAETNIPPCCEANICNKNPQESSYSGETIAIKKSGKTINTSVENFYNGIAAGVRTARSQPIFKSYYAYMQYLQGKTR